MTIPRSRVARVCHLLNREGARYLVVGATAMQLCGRTQDLADIEVLEALRRLRGG